MGQPGCENGEISGEHWGTEMVVEVAISVCGVPPLPMGIGRVDRHEGAGLCTDLEGVQGRGNYGKIEIA